MEALTRNSSMKEMLYAVRCLKSNEDMILALAGQFKQLSHETVVSRLLNYVRIHLSTLTKISVLQQRALLTGNEEGYFLATYLRSLSFV